MADKIKIYAFPYILASILTIFGFTFHYDNDVLSIGLVASALTLIFFFYFVLVKKVKKLGFLLYVPVLIMVFFVSYYIISGSGGFREFTAWMFDPSIENKGFDAASMLMMTFFFSSGIYYMSLIQYRSIFLFIICLTPLSVYAKAYVDIPVHWLVAVMLSFLCTVIYSQKNTDKKPVRQYFSLKSNYTVLALSFALVIITAILPKPQTTVFRKAFDQATNQYLGLSSMINPSNYFEQADKNIGFNFMSDKMLFMVDADEPTYLRRQVFDNYSYNLWKPLDGDKYITGYKEWENKKIYSSSNLFISIIQDVYRADMNNFPEYAKIILTQKYTETEKKITVNPVYDFDYQIMLSNINTTEIKTQNEYPIFKTQKDEFFLDTQIPSKSHYDILYYSNHFLAQTAENLTVEQYKNLLNYISQFDNENRGTLNEKQKKALKYLLDELNSAEEYSEDSYEEYADLSKLKELADSITQGCRTEYQKAKAIEQYFRNGEFTYDLDFVPQNPEPGYFLFESKRGICSDFATAMVLLSRQAGLYARYTEGYTAFDYSPQYQKYLVKESNGHAFAEIFIPGSGWTIFEATIPSEDDDSFFDSLNIGAAVILLIFIAILVVVYIFGKWINEFVFRLILAFRKNKLQIIYSRLIVLISKIAGINKENISARQLNRLVSMYTAEDISYLTDSFENLVYGNIVLSSVQITKCISIYKITSIKLLGISKRKTKHIL